MTAEELFQKARENHHKGHYKEAFDFCDQALEKFIKQKDLSGKADCYRLLGAMFVDKNNYDEALRYLKKAERTYIRANEYAEIWMIHQNLASLLLQHNIIDDAISELFSALKTLEEHGLERDQPKKHFIYGGLGNCYIKRKNYEKALECFDKAIELTKGSGQENFVPLYDLSRAISLQNIDKCEEALIIYHKWLEIEEKAIPESHYLCTNWTNYGATYKRLKENVNAIKCFEKSLDFNNHRFPEAEATTCYNLASTYLDLKEYSKAQSYIDQARPITEKLDIRELAYQATEIEMKLKVAQEIFKEAYELAQQLRAKDNDFHKEHKKLIAKRRQLQLHQAYEKDIKVDEEDLAILRLLTLGKEQKEIGNQFEKNRDWVNEKIRSLRKKFGAYNTHHLVAITKDSNLFDPTNGGFF